MSKDKYFQTFYYKVTLLAVRHQSLSHAKVIMPSTNLARMFKTLSSSRFWSDCAHVLKFNNNF